MPGPGAHTVSIGPWGVNCHLHYHQGHSESGLCFAWHTGICPAFGKVLVFVEESWRPDPFAVDLLLDFGAFFQKDNGLTALNARCSSRCFSSALWNISNAPWNDAAGAQLLNSGQIVQSFVLPSGVLDVFFRQDGSSFAVSTCRNFSNVTFRNIRRLFRNSRRLPPQTPRLGCPVHPHTRWSRRL